MTTDYLLKFPDRATAVQFGLANGFAVIDDEGNEQITLASHEYALCIIGEHNGDGQWWVLFRDLVDLPIPEGGEQFIAWASTSGEQRPAGESVPNIFWA
jgi:hypothetical protein